MGVSKSSAPKPAFRTTIGKVPQNNSAIVEFLDGLAEMIADSILEDQAKDGDDQSC